jgi:hypothetical protein
MKGGAEESKTESYHCIIDLTRDEEDDVIEFAGSDGDPVSKICLVLDQDLPPKKMKEFLTKLRKLLEDMDNDDESDKSFAGDNDDDGNGQGLKHGEFRDEADSGPSGLNCLANATLAAEPIEIRAMASPASTLFSTPTDAHDHEEDNEKWPEGYTPNSGVYPLSEYSLSSISQARADSPTTSHTRTASPTTVTNSISPNKNDEAVDCSSTSRNN